MDELWWHHLVHGGVSCGSIQSFGDGDSIDPCTVATGFRRWPVASLSGGFDRHRVQGLNCNFLFLKGFCAIQSKQLSAVSCSSVPVFGRILYGS